MSVSFTDESVASTRKALAALEHLARHDGSHDYGYCWGYTIFQTVYGPGSDDKVAQALARLAAYAEHFAMRPGHCPLCNGRVHRRRHAVICIPIARAWRGRVATASGPVVLVQAVLRHCAQCVAEERPGIAQVAAVKVYLRVKAPDVPQFEAIRDLKACAGIVGGIGDKATAGKGQAELGARPDAGTIVYFLRVCCVKRYGRNIIEKRNILIRFRR
ncbi:hypothetical protein PWT90_11023 [Aphanocladium album]|nr:hypothetical protein PWT90_11023 [Aphanocladium album]